MRTLLTIALAFAAMASLSFAPTARAQEDDAGLEEEYGNDGSDGSGAPPPSSGGPPGGMSPEEFEAVSGAGQCSTGALRHTHGGPSAALFPTSRGGDAYSEKILPTRKHATSTGCCDATASARTASGPRACFQGLSKLL
jgi:hypothetical protein